MGVVYCYFCGQFSSAVIGFKIERQKKKKKEKKKNAKVGERCALYKEVRILFMRTAEKKFHIEVLFYHVSLP